MLNILLISSDESLYRTTENISNGVAKLRKFNSAPDANGSLTESDVILFDADHCELKNGLLRSIMDTDTNERISKFFIALGSSIDPDFLAQHYSAGFEICLQKDEITRRLPPMLRAIKRARYY